MKFTGAFVLFTLAVTASTGLAKSKSSSQAIAAQLANSTAASNTSSVATPGVNAGSLNIDPNNIQGSLQNNLEQLILGMGVCGLDLSVLNGLSISEEVQLLSQMQQLAQLQLLGLISQNQIDQVVAQAFGSIASLNSFSVGGFSVLKRTVDTAIQQHLRRRRSVVHPRDCKAN